jgi:imidazolonepropionase-like amidohydrolase
MKRALWSFLTTLLFALPAQAETPQPIVITGVTIIDATGAPPQAGMTLVIEGERISEIGKTGRLALPAHARIVDGSGKFLIPGLWDMHVHWYDEPSLPLFLANGVTGIRIMCGYPRHLLWRKEIAAGRLLGPRLNLAGPIVDGPEPVWLDSLRASNETEGRLAVRSIKEKGYDCVKVYNFLPRDAYFGVAKEARTLRIPLVGHVPFAVSAAEASDAGQRTIEHLSALSLACSSREAELRRRWTAKLDPDAPATALHLRYDVEAEDSYDPARAAVLFATLVKNGNWVVPTLTVLQSHAVLRTKDPAADPRLRWLPFSLASRWGTRRTATLQKLGPADFENYQHALRKGLELVGALHRAGCHLLAGTDTGALDCYPGSSLHDELELLVQAGLTPLQALQTATSNVAQYLGRQDDLGTIERGKLADLVLLDADPLADIRNVRKVCAVVINGKLLQRADLNKLLRDVEAICRKENASSQPPGTHEKYP